MIRSIVTILILCFASLWSGRASGDNDPYAVLETFTSVTSKTINSAGCLITASADFDGFYKHLDTFRSAWLNKDYSIDFYNQRRKQVFVYLIVKRFAEFLTEGLYRQVQPQSCSFSIVGKFDDRLGNSKEIVVATWKFDQSTNAKVNWDKIDPRDFADIAIDYKITPEATSWASDEPSMTDNRASKARSDCQLEMLRANAIFIRATTYCKKNYMDSSAGYYALAMSRQCSALGDDKIAAIAMGAMKELDAVAKRSGRAAACHWVDAVEKEVLQSSTN